MNKLIDMLARSETFQEYSRAFSNLTGLPIALRPLKGRDLPFRGRPRENGFCAVMTAKSCTCAACLQVQERLCGVATQRPAMLTCTNGLIEGAVPIRLGNETIGFLQTGQVMVEGPDGPTFRRVAGRMRQQRVKLNYDALRKLYFRTPIVAKPKFAALLDLLSSFGDTLARRSNELAMQERNSEVPAVRDARLYIREHYAREIRLGEVAAAVHVSSYYFCKLFKRNTGMHFTEFVSRTRIEKAKNLLLNPNLRVSEIAYEIGFQSLTHFNRAFKEIVGQAPTEFRNRTKEARSNNRNGKNYEKPETKQGWKQSHEAIHPH